MDNNQIIINKKDAIFYSRYTLDYLGEVFTYEGRIFRLIKEDRIAYVKDLLSDGGALTELINENLFVKTTICENIVLSGEEKCIIVEHKKIEHITLYQEWTYSMFKAAMQAIASINLILAKYGLTLRDCHGANVVFIGTRPIYIDMGSIVPIVDGMEAYSGMKIYKSTWVNVLKLYRTGRLDDPFFRQLLISQTGISNDNLKLFCRPQTRKIIELKKKTEHYFTFAKYGNIESKGKIIKSIALAYRKLTSAIGKSDIRIIQKYYNKYVTFNDYSFKLYSKEWGEYQAGAFDDSGNVKRTQRVLFYSELTKKLGEKYKFKDAFELAGNSGLFSQTMLEDGTVDYVICSDMDEEAIDSGFTRCQKIVNICDKISFSRFNIISKLDEDNKYDRYRSDLVICLACTHHLFLTQRFKAAVFFKLLAKYCKKVAVVEFMPLGMWTQDRPDYYPEIPEWYTLEWFIGEMNRFFKIVHVEQIEKNRICVVGERLEMFME